MKSFSNASLFNFSFRPHEILFSLSPLISVIEELLDLFCGGNVSVIWLCFFLCWLRLGFNSLAFNLSRRGDLRLLCRRRIHGYRQLLCRLLLAGAERER